MNLYPLKLSYAGMYQSYLWGGRTLAPLVDAADTEPVAELWAVSDRPEEGKESRVANGEYAERTLVSLMQEDPTALLGFRPKNGRFPILVKILDAQKQLSVQVHPPQAVADQFNGQPKAEAWLFLEGTNPAATVYAGLKTGVTREQFRESLEAGTVEPLLYQIPAKPGTVMNIPNGRVHGINEGCFILEVQQSSNTTYRVFDYNRVDPKTSQPRPLHVTEALASIDFADYEPLPEQPTTDEHRTQLLTTEYFTIERAGGDSANQEQTNGGAVIVVNLNQKSELSVEANRVLVSAQQYETILVPAGIESFKVAGASLDYLLIRPVAKA